MNLFRHQWAIGVALGGLLAPGPLQLQDHGTQGRYWNVWLVEFKDGTGR